MEEWLQVIFRHHDQWHSHLLVLAPCWCWPMGRVALTNYLLQSLICTIFYGDFYGDGLGFLGQTGGILVCLW